MSISRFKFVSPGVFVKEIDKSQTPQERLAAGPTIIGRSTKGPMMRPVRVNSYADFVEVFGEPHPGGFSGDVWRSGVQLATTYGSYAAKAYLAFNGPVTFVRLGGYQHENAETDGKAGWQTLNTASITSNALNGGAFGLFICPTVSESNGYKVNNNVNVSSTGSLAAVFYLNEGSIGLKGYPLSGSTVIDGSGSTWIRSNTHAQKDFTVKLTDSDGVSKDIPFNFTPSSKDFIRNKFNTNPSAMNVYTNTATSVKDYFLGETFETHINNKVACAASTGSYAAFIMALQSGSIFGGNFRVAAKTSRTPWIIAQHKGNRANFDTDVKTRLFYFESLAEGEWNQNNIKISISDIKPSPNSYDKYGTFTVTLRKMSDNDLAPQPIEVFSNLSLNPLSPNFISKRIGDISLSWDADRKLYKEYGTYPNNSKYVRVVVDNAVENGSDDLADLLPFGFEGLQKFTSFSLTGSAAEDSAISNDAFVRAQFFNSPYQAANKVSGNYAYSASIVFPEISFVEDSQKSTATSLERTYWGVKTNIDNSKLFDSSVVDLLRIKPDSAPVTSSTVFSLDDVMFSGSTSTTVETTNALNLSKAYWAPGNRVAGKSITSKDSFLTAGSANGYGGTNFQKVARFTVPLYGGFDGFDIKEKEPLAEGSNHSLSVNSSETTSYVYNSIKVAIDAVSDPEVVETNLMVIPGIQNAKLTNYLIETCEQRGDALALIDIEGDFKSGYESDSTSTAAQETKPNISETILKIKERNLNSSYGCCFYPGVLAKDTSANALISLPSSVVALGVLGSSEAKSELWFAPAGFNRGGLTDGAAGFPVVGVKTKLTSKDRDNLYEVNINPIASFPAEGIVVFGQKTLQATPSALDRINVRRLMIYIKKEISRMANTVLFDQNVSVTWSRFTNQAEPFLASIKSRFGLTDYRVVLDQTTTTPELIDRNIVYAKIFLKPARAIEFIALDFILTNTGASFDD